MKQVSECLATLKPKLKDIFTHLTNVMSGAPLPSPASHNPTVTQYATQPHLSFCLPEGCGAGRGGGGWQWRGVQVSVRWRSCHTWRVYRVLPDMPVISARPPFTCPQAALTAQGEGRSWRGQGQTGCAAAVWLTWVTLGVLLSVWHRGLAEQEKCVGLAH